MQSLGDRPGLYNLNFPHKMFTSGDMPSTPGVTRVSAPCSDFRTNVPSLLQPLPARTENALPPCSLPVASFFRSPSGATHNSVKILMATRGENPLSSGASKYIVYIRISHTQKSLLENGLWIPHMWPWEGKQDWGWKEAWWKGMCFDMAAPRPSPDR